MKATVHMAIGVLADTLNELAQMLDPPKKRPNHSDEFQWVYEEESLRILLLAKAVRMTSAFNSAWILAQMGIVPESCSLLRIATDFSNEIGAMAVSEANKEFTTAQSRFMEQFFEEASQTPEEYEKRGRTRPVARSKLQATFFNFMNQYGMDGHRHKVESKFLDYIFDRYVHGSYTSAMGMYNGADGVFEMFGIMAKADEIQHMALLKLNSVLNAASSVAMSFDRPDLRDKFRAVRDKVDKLASKNAT